MFRFETNNFNAQNIIRIMRIIVIIISHTEREKESKHFIFFRNRVISVEEYI
jgi:hypothetical protein